jgi:surface antigen
MFNRNLLLSAVVVVIVALTAASATAQLTVTYSWVVASPPVRPVFNGYSWVYAYQSAQWWGPMNQVDTCQRVNNLRATGWTVQNVYSQNFAGRQCTEYLALRLGLPWTFPNAKDWGPWLRGQGFRQLFAPQAGCVAVFGAWSHGAGALGHVGIVNSAQGPNLMVVGANQLTANYYADQWAFNVSIIPFSVWQGDGSVTFWAR